MDNITNPFTGLVVFTHSSIGGKIEIVNQLNKMILFDKFISTIYISRADVGRDYVTSWCNRHKKTIVSGSDYIGNGARDHLNKLVVYLGKRRDVQEYKIAELTANNLGCDLIILP